MNNREKKAPSVRTNFLMNTFLTMSQFIFPLITFPYVSRTLQPVGVGKVTFATSVVSYFLILAQLGIPTYGIRACARVRDDREKLTRTVHELLFINVVTCALAYVLFFGAIMIVPRFRHDWVLMLVVSFSMLFNTIGVEWLYKAIEQYTYITVRSILFKLVAVVAMIILVHRPEDYVIYGGISIFAASASNLLNFINLHKHIGLRPVGDFQPWRHLKAVLVFFAMSCTTTIYTNLDTVMLGFMQGDAEVGYYNTAVKIRYLLVCLVTSLGAVLLPRVSYYIEKKQLDEFYRVNRKAMNFMLLLAAPLTVYFTLFANEGIAFIASSEFANAAFPLRLLLPTILLIGMTNLTGLQVLVPMGKEKIVFISTVCGAITDLIANAILIPSMASAGAAIGTLIAEMVVWVVQHIALRKTVGQLYTGIRYFSIVVALIAGGIASFWVHYCAIGTFWTLAVSAILFFCVYGGLLLLLREPLVTELVQQLVHKASKLLKREV